MLGLEVALFNSGIMLVLNIWAHKFSPTPMNCSRDIEDIRRIVDMLKSVEPRYVSSIGAQEMTLTMRVIAGCTSLAECCKSRSLDDMFARE